MADTIIITTQDLEPAVRLKDAFQDEGFSIELLTPGERLSDVPDPVLLILTGGLDEKQSRRLLREAIEHDQLPVIALVESAADHGAGERSRYHGPVILHKPIDPDEVVRAGRRLMDRKRLRRVTGIIGETDAMIEVLERVVQIAPVSSTVLVTGESGTGKELVARGIHALSMRRHRPFIAANVAALPETLLESELFGHEKGAFTGAVGQRKGLFELANHGTLFLDEIGELPPTTQTKLLRVLEEQQFMRLGGEAELNVDVRVIAATNQNLRQLVELGRFRRDLYYRLNVLTITLPALRERRADIALVVDHFIREASAEHDRPRIAISPEVMEILTDYAWPGNVRELKNLVESMVVLSPGTIIRPQDIPDEIRRRGGGMVPVPAPRPRAEGSNPSPELEFIFHTLLQLRIDVEDLRNQFENYRRDHPELPQPRLPHGVQLPAPAVPHARAIVDVPVEEDSAEDLEKEHEVVVYRPGMTLRDLEEAAITAALREVAGNRRRAADMLGMGERTLYRKIKEYAIPL